MINVLLDVGLGEDFVGQFVDDSLRDIAVVFDRVKEAASSGNRLGFRDEIHTLRGIAMNIGALRLAGACADKSVLAPGRPNREVRDYACAVLEVLVDEVREALPAVASNLRMAESSRPGSSTTH